MKHFIILLLATLGFADDFHMVYVHSPGIKSNLTVIGKDTILTNPQIVEVAYYTDQFKGKRFMLLPLPKVVGTKSDFYGLIAVQCMAFENIFKTGYCMVYHRTIPFDADSVSEFQDVAADVFRHSAKCFDDSTCEIRFAH